MANRRRDPSPEGAARRRRIARWLYEDGESAIHPNIIAELLSVCPRTVQRYLGRDGRIHGARSKQAMKRIRDRTRARRAEREREERDKAIERVRDEYRQGLPILLIAHRAGIDKRTIYRWLGDTPRRREAPEPEPEPAPTLPEQVRAEYDAGRTLGRIAVDARIPIEAVRRALRESYAEPADARASTGSVSAA